MWADLMFTNENRVVPIFLAFNIKVISKHEVFSSKYRDPLTIHYYQKLLRHTQYIWIRLLFYFLYRNHRNKFKKRQPRYRNNIIKKEGEKR